MAKSARKGGTIAGRITTLGGTPVGNAAVLITGDSPTHQDIAALTNAQGEYRLAGLVAGDYTVLVNAAGYKPSSDTIRVSEVGGAELNFTLSE